MRLLHWMPLTFLFPSRYLDTDFDWEGFDLVAWSRDDYRWPKESWNGLIDIAQPPAETVERRRGDCGDFALVAASWAWGNGREGVGVGLCWELRRPWPTHVIAYDDEFVYSAGGIWKTSVAEWRKESPYVFVLKRRVR